MKSENQKRPGSPRPFKENGIRRAAGRRLTDLLQGSDPNHPSAVGVSPPPEPITKFVFVKLVLSDFSLPILPRIEVTRRQVARTLSLTVYL